MKVTVIGSARAVPPLNGRSRLRGFSAIELMISLSIVAILGTLALPAFQSALRKGNRSDAKAIMMETAQYMERYYTTNKTYVGAAVLSAVSPKGSTASGVKYNISWSVTPTVSAYTLQAVPANSQVGDICGTLTLSSVGAQTAASSNCW